MKTYLVTGGGGFIGSALVRRLCQDGHQVRVLDDFSRGRQARLDFVHCEVIHGDIRNPGAVRDAMQGCDSVAHLAYLQGTQVFHEEPRQVLDVAIRGMLNVLDACEATGCSEMLLLSSSEAYNLASDVPTPETVALMVPDPLNPRFSYGGGKIACEIMANAWWRTGVLTRLIVARAHNVCGPDMGREHVLPQFAIRMNELIASAPGDGAPLSFPIQGSGDETRSLCDISDCTDQLAFLLEHAGRLGVYHVGATDERTIGELADAVAACYDREIKIAPGALPEGSPVRRCPDIGKILALGYPGPQVPFEGIVQNAVTWYQDNG